MSEKKQPSEFTCDVMQRFEQKQTLAKNKQDIEILENAINNFNTTHAALSAHSASEIKQKLDFIKQLLKVEKSVLDCKLSENNRIIHSLLESAIEFK